MLPSVEKCVICGVLTRNRVRGVLSAGQREALGIRDDGATGFANVCIAHKGKQQALFNQAFEAVIRRHERREN